MEDRGRKLILFALLVAGVLLLFGSVCSADYLPPPVNETQVISLDTVVDVTGQYSDDTSFNGVLSSDVIHDDRLYDKERVAVTAGSDTVRSNGGKLSLSKGYTANTALGQFNIEKVFTYGSTEGAHLTGYEDYSLDTAGNWSYTQDAIRCVFASAKYKYIPAFCNIVKTKSELVNINSAQVSTKGDLRPTSLTALGLDYQIAVSPDSNSGSGFADGTVKTTFAGSIMEARMSNDAPGLINANVYSPAATNQWKDSASVSGGIKSMQKSFTYDTGVAYT